MEAVINTPASSGAKASAKQPSVIITKARASDIAAALMAVSGVIERRHTLPILANVLIAKRGGTLDLIGSDLELQMRSHAELGHGGAEVTTTVNARKLLEMLKSMPAEQTVTLTLNGEKLAVSGGKSRFTVQTIAAAEFPLLSQPKEISATLKIEQKVLASLIAQVQYAMATSDIRAYLNAMMLETDGDTVTVAATDGHRLAVTHATVQEPMEKSSVLLPRKAVLELARLLKGGEGEMEVLVTPNQAIFRFGSIEFTTKLIDAKYPDYKRVIPKNHSNEVLFERTMLLQALQRAALMTAEKFKSVKLTFSKETLQLEATNAEQEEAHEEIGIDYNGRKLEIGFNVGYLIEALSNMGGDTVKMAFGDAGSSTLITDDTTPELRAVCMPMRI